MTDKDLLPDGVYKVDYNDVGVNANNLYLFYYVFINNGRVHKVENSDRHIMRNHNFYHRTKKYAIY